MKWLAKILLYVLAAYGAYAIIRPYLEQSDLIPVAANAQQKKISSATHGQKIVCPTCQGEGRLTYIDSRRKNHSYGCPICGFSGTNTIYPPKDAHICADCKGMGRTEIRIQKADIEGIIIEASRCQRCNSTGWILPRSAPGSSSPTKHVIPPEPARQ